MEDKILRIVVPLDGSPEGDSILAALRPMAHKQPVELTLLRVAPHTEAVDNAWHEVRATYKQLLLEGVRSTYKLEFGDPADEILHLARPFEYDLIAMATHGRSGLRRLFLGSVTESVLRRSRVPLLVHRPRSRVGDWKRIVVALDGTRQGEEILPEVARLAKAIGATLHLFRTSLPLPAYVEAPLAPVYIPWEDPEPYLEEVCKRLAVEGLIALPVTREGWPDREIPRYAEEIGAGLIAMTTHGRRGVDRFLAGSVAEDTLRHAPCPVMIRRLAPELVVTG